MVKNIINKIKGLGKMKKNLSWIKFAFSEGVTKAINKSFHKYIGTYVKGHFGTDKLEGAFFVPMITASVQMIGGLIGSKIRKMSIFPAYKQILGSMTFGFIAAIMSFLSVYGFTYPGNDLAVMTFLITLSIIPSRIIDRILYKEKLLFRQYIGLTSYILVAYVFLRDFRDPGALFSMPPWAWVSLLIGLLLSINNLVTRKLEKADGFVHNFWVGLATVLVGFSVVTFFGLWPKVLTVEWHIFGILIIMGSITLIMILSKLAAYQSGASLTFEVFIQQSTYLILVTIFGVIFFSEQMTLGKWLGIPGFAIAFVVANQEMWEYATKKVKKIFY